MELIKLLAHLVAIVAAGGFILSLLIWIALSVIVGNSDSKFDHEED